MQIVCFQTKSIEFNNTIYFIYFLMACFLMFKSQKLSRMNGIDHSGGADQHCFYSPRALDTLHENVHVLQAMTQSRTRPFCCCWQKKQQLKQRFLGQIYGRLCLVCECEWTNNGPYSMN